MKHYLLTLLLLAFTLPGMAQTILPDGTLNADFANYVKSVDEFMQRFNGDEPHPGLKKTDIDYRLKNLMWLFNFNVKNKAELMPKMKAFAKSVVDSGTRLAFNDSTWFALADITAKYRGKDVELTIVLCTEATPKPHYAWQICGVQGISKLGLYTPGKRFSISGTEHEMSFAELNSVFKNNRENLFGYISRRNHVDRLSVFMTLCRTGLLTFGHVTGLRFVFTSVPGYVFTISEYGRRGSNAGWLISSFEKCSDKNKLINNLTNH